MRRTFQHLTFFVALCISCARVEAFVGPAWRCSTIALFQSATTDEEVSRLRVSEIRAALNELKVDYSDCFDKESLMQRLRDARDGTEVQTESSSAPTADNKKEDANATCKVDSTSSTTSSSSTKTATTSSKTIIMDEAALLEELRAMRVKELRQELASRNLRWAGLLEKEDLVKAVLQARLKAAHFSVTGLVTPGQVADLNAQQVQQEIKGGSTTTTPLLLDCYATWCGPCQLLQGQLKEVAADMQDRVRIVKMDTDKNQEMASQLRVQGLPTIVLFDASGKELDRIEGALMKDQLIQWMESKLR